MLPAPGAKSAAEPDLAANAPAPHLVPEAARVPEVAPAHPEAASAPAAHHWPPVAVTNEYEVASATPQPASAPGAEAAGGLPSEKAPLPPLVVAGLAEIAAELIHAPPLAAGMPHPPESSSAPMSAPMPSSDAPPMESSDAPMASDASAPPPASAAPGSPAVVEAHVPAVVNPGDDAPPSAVEPASGSVPVSAGSKRGKSHAGGGGDSSSQASGGSKKAKKAKKVPKSTSTSS